MTQAPLHRTPSIAKATSLSRLVHSSLVGFQFLCLVYRRFGADGVLDAEPASGQLYKDYAMIEVTNKRLLQRVASHRQSGATAREASIISATALLCAKQSLRR